MKLLKRGLEHKVQRTYSSINWRVERTEEWRRGKSGPYIHSFVDFHLEELEIKLVETVLGTLQHCQTTDSVFAKLWRNDHPQR